MLGAMGEAPGSRAPSASDVDNASGDRVPVVVNGEVRIVLNGEVRIVVNGEVWAMPAGATVADVVGAWCHAPQGIAVARNREVVPRSEWAATPVVRHDRVEIVTAAAGG